MTIPDSTLRSWTSQGSTAGSAITYHSVQTALKGSNSPIAARDFDIYLQGSYGNDTNIRGDSDVDVVVQLNETFEQDLSLLTLTEQQARKSVSSPATYTLSVFRADVLRTLRAYYGSGAVTDGNKCIDIAGTGNRVTADAVVCLEYRRYLRYNPYAGQDSYAPGIVFYTQREGRRVINYPKLHRQNGVAKQAATGDRYKATVRMFKNARNEAERRRIITVSLGSSYFLECLLYNVPNSQFYDDLQLRYLAIINWLGDAALGTFLCQNEQLYLFGPTSEQWDTAKAKAFINGLRTLYLNW